jgi:hypothetical protein
MNPTRRLFVLAFAVALATPSFAVANEPAAAPSTGASIEPLQFGAPITVKKALPVAKLEKKPARFNGKTVKVEGTVRGVCQGQGCWIEIEAADGATILAKSLDESVLVPKDCQGWQVIVQGVVTRLAAKGHEEHAHAHAEIGEGHSCPAPSYVLATQGVVLKRAVAAKN